jgi:hypothetical protein
MVIACRETVSTTQPQYSYCRQNNGNVSVRANNACGSGPERTLSVTALKVPSQPATITGEATVCSGSTQIYNVSAVSGANSYTWVLPSGWTGSSTTTSLTATAGTSGGTVSVTASNACGTSTARTVNVSVVTTPAQPAP